MTVRALALFALCSLVACGSEKEPPANPTCAPGLANIKQGWSGLDTRIRASLESDSWCFKDPAELRAVLGRAVEQLERLQTEQPTTRLSTLTDERWVAALTALREKQAQELAIAGDLQCPDTAMVLTFKTAQQILDATKEDAAPALTLLDEQRNPVQMPWTPRVLMLAVNDAPARIDAMVRSSVVQRDRSARLRTQVAALVRTLGTDTDGAKRALDAVDESLVPILHEQIAQAKGTTASWLTQCGVSR